MSLLSTLLFIHHLAAFPLGAGIVEATFAPLEAVLEPSVDHHDVSELRPAQITSVMALGDSITSGFGAEDWPVENSWLSWSAGIGSRDQRTMPYLLRALAKARFGGASQNWQSMSMFVDPYMHPDVIHLNAAITGCTSHGLHSQVEHLIERYPFEVQNRRGWKVVTIFAGANDVCARWDTCYSTGAWTVENYQNDIADRFQHNIENVIEHLIDGFGGQIYINLVSLFNIGSLGRLSNENWMCRLEGQFLDECPCIQTDRRPDGTSNDFELSSKLVDAAVAKLNERIELAAAKYDRFGGRKDIGVNLVTTFKQQNITAWEWLSKFDCFHPNAKAHDILGVGLWNAMLNVSQPTPLESVGLKTLPVSPNTRLVTYRDRRTRASVGTPNRVMPRRRPGGSRYDIPPRRTALPPLACIESFAEHRHAGGHFLTSHVRRWRNGSRKRHETVSATVAFLIAILLACFVNEFSFSSM